MNKKVVNHLFEEALITEVEGFKKDSVPLCWPAIELFQLFVSRYHVDNVWKDSNIRIPHLPENYKYEYFCCKFKHPVLGEKFIFCMQKRVKEKWYNLFVLNEKDEIVFAYDYWPYNNFLLGVDIGNQKKEVNTMSFSSESFNTIQNLIKVLKGKKTIQKELLIELLLKFKN